MTEEFGRIELVPVRTGWPDEARDFTPWLAANLDRLGEHLGLALELRGTEHAVGRYALDILCEDVTGRVVIVENQLESSDHTHLGQLLTYCAGTGAKVLVWVAPSFTDEHIAALEWLNANTVEDVGFFAVEVQLVRIGDSPLAPQFNPVVRPNEFVKSTRTETARSEWDWQSYADQLRVPTERLATGRRLVERLLGLIEERQLPWQPKFNKGHVSIQRAGGYNVLLVDLVYSKPVRLIAKIPKSPDDLALADPYPELGGWWHENSLEWSWHVPAEVSESLDLSSVVDIVQRYHDSDEPAPEVRT